MTLRARITAGFVLVLVAFLVIGAVVVVTQRGRLIDQLENQLMAVAPLNRGAPPPAGATAPPEPRNENSPGAPLSDLFIASVTPDGAIEVRVEGQLLETTPQLAPEIGSGAVRRQFDTVPSVDGTTQFRVLIDPSNASGEVVVIALPMNDIDDSIRQLIVTLALLAAIVGAVLGLLAWWIIRLGLRPISEMTATATTIAAGDRDQRVQQLDPRTEAGQLAAAFNEMLDQRDGAEDRLRRFASDASHELRTPLTSITGYLDLYAQGGFREPGQLDDVVKRMQSEASRMGGLVEDLLELARFDEAQELQRTVFDPVELISDVVSNARAAHPERRIDVEADTSLPTVRLDKAKVEQLLSGLVANALKHAPDASVLVKARGVQGQVELIVSDDGPGLTTEQADRVFERFYRGDSTRARSTGGSGLGLAIAQSIALAHGGSIDLTTAPGAGCEFTVRLPNS